MRAEALPALVDTVSGVVAVEVGASVEDADFFDPNPEPELAFDLEPASDLRSDTDSLSGVSTGSDDAVASRSDLELSD